MLDKKAFTNTKHCLNSKSSVQYRIVLKCNRKTLLTKQWRQMSNFACKFNLKLFDVILKKKIILNFKLNLTPPQYTTQFLCRKQKNKKKHILLKHMFYLFISIYFFFKWQIRSHSRLCLTRKKNKAKLEIQKESRRKVKKL